MTLEVLSHLKDPVILKQHWRGFTSISRANNLTFGQRWQPWWKEILELLCWRQADKLKTSCHGSTEYGMCCPLLALTGDGDPARYKCLDQAVVPKSEAENLDGEDHRCSGPPTQTLLDIQLQPKPLSYLACHKPSWNPSVVWRLSLLGLVELDHVSCDCCSSSRQLSVFPCWAT